MEQGGTDIWRVVEALSQAVLAVAAILAAITWRFKLVGTEKYEVAREFSRKCFSVLEAIRILRSTGRPGDAERLLNQSLFREDIPPYLPRLIGELRWASLEASLVLDRDADKVSSEFLRCVGTWRVSAHSISVYEQDKEKGKTFLTPAQLAENMQIFSAGTGGDLPQMEDAMKTLEEFVRPYLHLSLLGRLQRWVQKQQSDVLEF